MKKLSLLTLLFFIFIIVLKITSIRFNYTDSMPVGFYKKIQSTAIHDDDLVAVCLPDHIADIGLKNHYLALGSCKNGSVPVLKKVIAVPQDSVFLSNQFITVNGLSYPAPRQYTDNHNHRVKKLIQYGRYSPAETYWLYGANDPIHSWDSRYYGGVTRKHIIGVYKPLLIF